jgi:aryl-alcohol dehydrogenase-like predicted oxidoreductase
MAATLEGTRRYAERFKGALSPDHFRETHGFVLSSIGLGTYLGEADSNCDEAYRRALIRAVELGANVIDTAINYRCQRSERTVGQAFRELEASGVATREELVVATKAGYLTFDGGPPLDARQYFHDTLVRPGIVSPHDVIAGSHCITPRYLEHQIEQSLRNLGVHAIDIFYIHNPETQLAEIARDEFYKRLRVAFGYLETAVRAGKIRRYGIATWNAFRAPTTAREYISLEQAVQCARDVADDAHHFQFVQLPYNLGMTEAFSRCNQTVGGHVMSALGACRELGIAVMASASILQRRLAHGLPTIMAERFPRLQTDAQRAIQFVRSTPGIAVALVGMSRLSHVEENLRLAQVPSASEVICKMFDAA